MKLKTFRTFFAECDNKGLDFFDGPDKATRRLKCPKHQGICGSRSCPKKMDYLIGIINKITKGD